MTNNRICLECVHCHVSPGSPGYSEYTPGTGFSFWCAAGKKFKFDEDYGGDRSTLLADIRQAATCAEFKSEPEVPK